MTVEELQEDVWQYARAHGRSHLPWREDPAPYKVLVSELMLQQTQVERVAPKFNVFLETFPDVAALAEAPLSEVLIVWQGLGYNRRAKFLHQAAKEIVQLGKFPTTKEELVRLPGVGPNTAGAILAYAFNEPVVYIETNIRTVFIHHFFADRFDVDDKELLPFIEAALEREHPREWYSALMDYGTHLKRQGFGKNSSSKHYKKQSQFKGSVREMRGRIIRALSEGTLSMVELRRVVEADGRFERALAEVVEEGLVVNRNSLYALSQ